MFKAEVGDVVGIHYDADPGVKVSPGDFLQTRTGRTYKIVNARQQKRGKYIGRYHLQCRVVEKATGLGFVHMLYWYKR